MKKVLLAVVLLGVLVFTGCTGGTPKETVKVVTIADLQAELEAQDQTISALQSSIAGLVRKSDYDKAVADLAALKTKVDNIQIPAAGMTAVQINALLDPLKAQIAALSAEIKAMKAPPVTTSPGYAIEATIKYMFPLMPFQLQVTNGAISGQGMFRLEVKNNTDQVISNVILFVYFTTPDAVTYSAGTKLVTVASVVSSLSWMQYNMSNPNMLVFTNGFGMNIPANSVQSFDLTLTVVGTITAATAIETFSAGVQPSN